MPCLDNWKAFIFASILCGRPPALACELRRPDKFKGALGLRALFNIPIGVEEALKEFVVRGSDTDRREGIRGTFVLSVGGLPAGGASGDSAGSVVRGIVAKSTESSGALGGPLFGGVAMADSDIYCRDMSLRIVTVEVGRRTMPSVQCLVSRWLYGKRNSRMSLEGQTDLLNLNSANAAKVRYFGASVVDTRVP